ncbi:MAG: error-prone DNA polymerase [Vicinamibacteria bacterium]|nr:error-prone DNA polymerase [Vicinamibacteria bacterium]
MDCELHMASAFSFLRGSSSPEELVAQAARMGHGVVGLADRDGLAGAPRFFQAAKKAGIRPVVGAEVSLTASGSGKDRFVTLLVESREGYRNLSRLLTSRARTGAASGTEPHAGSPSHHPGFDDPESLRGLVALTSQPDDIDVLFPLFGRERTLVEVQRHLTRESHSTALGLLDLAEARGLRAIATNGVLHAKPQGRRLVDVFTCLRNHTTLSRAGRLLSENAERHLKKPADMQSLFADRPDVLRNTEALADRLRFTLDDLGYRFPDYPLPPGETNDSFLRAITEAGANHRYRPYHDRARAQIEKELAVIAKLGLAGYFLIVWDLMQFCKAGGILAQGRGSAANSAVCYSLGITAVDPVGMELLFERFLSEERGEWPDIDIDLPSGDRREKVIQHVYTKYGPHGAAMTANVITYREKSASREIGKVLELPDEMVDNVSRQMLRFEWHDTKDTFDARLERAGVDRNDLRLKVFARLFHDIQDLPRHLGQHSGGMIVAQGRLDEVVPLQPASMPGRTIVQWDKEDCADLGIIKVDLLGLGMMAALQDSISILSSTGVDIDLAHLPPDDPKTYAMLRAADTVGVFQVESRAQMATLPRMKPERFYDLVVEVAIIRPGPIVGQMVHPYLDRRAGRKPVEYPHPSLEPILKRTLGVPLFQEQLLRMAMTVAGFTGGEAEELRRAMGFKRSEKRMAEIETKLREGMGKNGIAGATQNQIVKSIASFALYGFPESHAASFALIAYASAYLRAHHHAAFVCALLNNQPMGFYHPMTLVKDAQRHGVKFLPVDVTKSEVVCILEDGSLRLGLNYVTSLRTPAAVSVVEERNRRPFVSIEDFARRTKLHADELERLASIGAFAPFDRTRRDALWQVAALGRSPGPLFETPRFEETADIESAEPSLRGGHRNVSDEAISPSPSPLPAMSTLDRLRADITGTDLTIGPHPVARFREWLRGAEVLRAIDLPYRRDGDFVRVAGAVICRQRPGTAKGFLFLTLEDETGLVNVIVRPDQFDRFRRLLTDAPLLRVDGVLQSKEGITVRAMKVSLIHEGPEEALPKIPVRSFGVNPFILRGTPSVAKTRK